MNSQVSVTDQLNKLIDLAHQNGLYDAADWVRTRMQQRSRLKHYKHPDLGIIVATVGHEDGDFTLLMGHTQYYSWIRTADLYDTREEAEAAPAAKFAGRPE